MEDKAPSQKALGCRRSYEDTGAWIQGSKIPLTDAATLEAASNNEANFFEYERMGYLPTTPFVFVDIVEFMYIGV